MGRGRGRVGTCDIGAFESQGFTFTSQTGTPQSAVFNTAFSTPLGLAVTANLAGEPVDTGVITFRAPSSGASITTPSFTRTVADGMVSQSVTANGTIGGPYNVTASASGASSVNFVLTNTDVPATITLASSPASLAEDAASSLAYTFTRSGNTTGALTVGFSVSGTAVYGPDYTQTGAGAFSAAAGSVTFAAGSSTAAISIDPSADSTVELNETVILTLAEGTGYTAGSPDAATGTITNDDSAAASIANASAAEGENLSFTVTLTNPSDAPVSLTYSTANGTATTADSDYTAKTNQTLTIPAGQTSGTITVATTADLKPEPDETLTVSLSGVDAGGRSITLGAGSSGTGTIQNNDFAPTATTNPATAITTSGAALNGTVNANNANTSVTFEYGTDTTYGTTVTADPATVTGSTNTSVSAVLTGLAPDTTYYYRVTATNSAGTTRGLNQTFKTAKPAPGNPNLASLSLSSGSLAPVFHPATTEYAAVVDYSVASLTVRPTAVEAQATIKVNGITVASGADSGAVALSVGTNTITIVVTAQDGITEKTYTITVTRLPEWKVYLPVVLK